MVMCIWCIYSYVKSGLFELNIIWNIGILPQGLLLISNSFISSAFFVTIGQASHPLLARLNWSVGWSAEFWTRVALRLVSLSSSSLSQRAVLQQYYTHHMKKASPYPQKSFLLLVHRNKNQLKKSQFERRLLFLSINELKLSLLCFRTRFCYRNKS